MHTLLLAMVVIASSVHGQLPEASPQELQKWLASPQAAAKTVGCFIHYVHQYCDPRSRNIGGLMPSLIKNNFKCLPQCSDNSQRAVTFIANTLRTRYPDQWQRLGRHFSSSSSSQSQRIPQASAAELRQWLSSPTAAERTITCVINYRPDCDPRAQAFARVLPSLAQNNFQCRPPQCPAGTQESMDFFLTTLREYYPDQLRRVQQHLQG